MGSELDLDDVVSGCPKAAAELDDLRDLLREARVREEKANERASRLEQIVSPLRPIAERMANQDNRATADVFFLVEERVRDYGIDKEVAENTTFIDDEGQEVTPGELDEDGDPIREDDSELTQTGYRDRWQYVQAFLTEEAAEDYRQTQAHNLHKPTRTFGDSACRNPEIRELRKALLALHEDSRSVPDAPATSQGGA